MRVFWEKLGVLYPIYCLVGRGWNDDEIAIKLGLRKLDVQSCVAWMLNFLRLGNRSELIQHALTLGETSVGERRIQ
jgi:hypothetical protein